MNFEEYFLITEAKKKVGHDKGKVIKMNTEDVLINVKKTRSSKDDSFAYQIQITALSDPNVKGLVQYQTNQDMKQVYRLINSSALVLNFIHRYMKTYECYNLIPLFNREVLYMKKNLSQEEINDLNLDFTVVSTKESSIDNSLNDDMSPTDMSSDFSSNNLEPNIPNIESSEPETTTEIPEEIPEEIPSEIPEEIPEV